MNITFDYPWALWGFIIIIPFIIYDMCSLPRRRKGMPPVLARRLAASTTLFGFFLALGMISLAGPQWGSARGSETSGLESGKRGVDIVMALDVSGSMDISDVPDDERGAVSRLERGLSLAFETVSALPDPRYAVVTGRGRGILAVPLTWDSAAVLNFFEAVDSKVLTGRGTNLESLLDCAAGAFQDSSAARRIVVLISDGETLSGSVRAAAARLKQNNIAVAALALGSDEGRPLEGQPDTISRRDAQVMVMSAEMSGGIYIDANRDDARALLFEYLRVTATRAGNSGAGKKSRWFLFLVAAIVCYGLSKLSLLKK